MKVDDLIQEAQSHAWSAMDDASNESAMRFAATAQALALIVIAERLGQLVEQGQVVTTLEEISNIPPRHNRVPRDGEPF